ncbi:unnamed protein product [Urochloa humidicola]
MENFLVAAAGAVGAAIVQEAASRGASWVLGKRKAKASQGQYLERLRFELKHDFIKAACLLSRRRNKRRSPQGQPQPEISQADELVLSYDDVERFEQFADSAQNILRRVESERCKQSKKDVFMYGQHVSKKSAA